MTILEKILDFSYGEKFYRFGNADGKYWIMPARGMHTAMNLYQPSGTKGRMVKSLLPYLHVLPPVHKIIHAQTLHCRLNKELEKLLCDLFGTEELEFSIFEGTPSVHKKVTMQLSNGKKILGYCKLSESDNIKELFDKESKMLSWLEEREINGIPRILYCGTLSNGMHVFVQSTAKTASSAVIHEWNKLHEDFLSQLHEKSKQLIQFEESDLYKSIIALEKHFDWLPDNIDEGIILKAISDIKKRYCGCEVEFSAYHGDFTPWNMFVEKKELFVFDFEYAGMSYPAGLDRYHFFTQTAIFERNWGADDIIAFIENGNCKWIDKLLYKIYLLDMVSRFTMRENGKVNDEAAKPFELWGKILESIMSDN